MCSPLDEWEEEIRNKPSESTGGFLLYEENHSLGEWFKRRLMAIMKKEKLLLLYNELAVWQLQETTKGGQPKWKT